MVGRTISTEDLLLRIARDEALAQELAMFAQLYDSGGVAFDLASDLGSMGAVRQREGRTPDRSDVEYIFRNRLDEFEAAFELAREYYALYPHLFIAAEDKKTTETEGA